MWFLASSCNSKTTTRDCSKSQEPGVPSVFNEHEVWPFSCWSPPPPCDAQPSGFRPLSLGPPGAWRWEQRARPSCDAKPTPPGAPLPHPPLGSARQGWGPLIQGSVHSDHPALSQSQELTLDIPIWGSFSLKKIFFFKILSVVDL